MSAQVIQTVVDQITALSYNVRNFRLRLAQPNRMAFEAGQFVIVHVPKDGVVVKRAYSIASPPHEEGVIELCIQHVEKGIATSYFWQLKEGMTVMLSGPHGKFTFKQPIAYEPVFMATGTGVAPFRGMIKHLFHLNATQPIWLFFGCRYEHTLLYEPEFRALASLRARGLITEVGRAGSAGRPYLFGTTFRFLEYFGLEKPEDLPPLEEGLEEGGRRKEEEE
jgi:NAD(P)H-flavin reductase